MYYRAGKTVPEITALLARVTRKNSVYRALQHAGVRLRRQRTVRPRFDLLLVAGMYRAGKRLGEISKAMGYPSGKGNNRTSRALIRVGGGEQCSQTSNATP